MDCATKAQDRLPSTEDLQEAAKELLFIYFRSKVAVVYIVQKSRHRC